MSFICLKIIITKTCFDTVAQGNYIVDIGIFWIKVCCLLIVFLNDVTEDILLYQKNEKVVMLVPKTNLYFSTVAGKRQRVSPDYRSSDNG